MNLRKRYRLGADERAYIDVVPLVDTLLAVFLFLAILAFQSPITFLAVKLPKAEEGDTQRLLAVRVQILPNGSYLLEGKASDLKEIESFLREKKPKTLVIEADEEVAHKFVVYLMDRAKKAEVENVIISVRKK